jgi:DNA-binding NarL/FixJ family response regulator
LNRQHRLLVVEDNPTFAAQIRHAIERLPQAWVITMVSAGCKAIDVLKDRDAAFDLALVDIGLPDVSGIDVIRACAMQSPEMPVVVISVVASEPVVLSAIEAGAKGYILKGDSIEAITQGITQVLDGIYPLSPSLARFLFKKLGSGTVDESPSTENEFKLTPREVETLRHLANGLSYQEAATQMGVALSTVQWNIRNLYRKLNVRSQVKAILKARDHKLI